MTRTLKLATASAVALTLAACATTETADYEVVETVTPVTTTTTIDRTQTLSDAQQVGVNDADGYASTGANQKLDDKFKVDCNDNDQYMAEGCESATMTKTETTMVKETTLVPQKTVLQLISESPDHSRLARAILAADLDDDIAALPNGFTIFAPTDAAFDAAALEGLSDDQDLEMLLMNHIIPSKIMSVDLVGLVPVTGIYNADTLGDRTLDFMRSGETVRVVGYDQVLIPISTVDMIGTDGVIHSIGTVLVPDYDSPDTADENS